MNALLNRACLMTLFIASNISAQQVCKDYIDDNWSNSRYIIQNNSGETTVIDTQSKLMWQQCAYGLSGVNCVDGLAISFSWDQALNVVTTQNNIGYAGFNDWRLPNIKEILTLSARNCYFPALNKTIFPNAPQYMWTSTPSDMTANESWVMDFRTGYDETQPRVNLLHVFMVRNQ